MGFKEFPKLLVKSDGGKSNEVKSNGGKTFGYKRL